MTDLPRFYDGAVGKLDFTTMNEMMKRLDLLLPLVQNAAGGGGWVGDARSTVFPVYAERSAYKTDDGAFKYNWWEITVVGNAMAWAGQSQTDEGDTQLRVGVATDGGGAQFGLFPYNPREDPPEDPFVEGFALAVIVRSGNTESQEGGIRCVLFPIQSPISGMLYVQIADGTPEVVPIQVGSNTRSVREYPATLLRAEPDVDGDAAFSIQAEDVVAVDLNSSSINEPTITGSDTELTPRLYDAGTIFQATKIGEGKYAFTHLIRFDVTCS